MSTIPSTHATVSPATPDLPRSLVWLLAAGAGLGVAPLYYSQPMLALIGTDLNASTGLLGLVPMMAQLGYALGILLLAPLGDRIDRRRIILAKTAVLACALLASGLSPNLPMLLVASLATGLAATLAQDIVPAAATLAPPAHRGRIVGTVMTGLLMGILLSRVISGALAEQTGWRSVYVAAALLIVVAGGAFWRGLPRFVPTTQLGYGALLASMAGLWRQYPALRRAAYAQGLLAVAFSAFWSTLAVMLHETLHLGSAAAGAFGLAGAAGALAAPLAGRLADRRGPEIVVRLGAALSALSFAVLAFGTGLSAHGQVVLIVVSAVGFDFGIQAALIAHQTQVYSLEPAARSRLNAVLFTGMFVGMAGGAALGSVVLAYAGWTGVAVLCTASALAALGVRLARGR